MDTESTKHRRQKSPNAPAYSLQECLEDARRVYRAENQVPISRESIAEHLNLAPQSGPFHRKLSSLRQYGLLEPVGKDLRVTDLFLRIDLTADESERRRGLRESLGRPTIFQGLLSQYEFHGLPSDINLTNQLILKYRFTKKNAETVAKAFLESCRSAGLTQGRPAPNPLPPSAPPQTSQPQLSTLLTSHPEHHPSHELKTSQCRQEIPLAIGRRAILELPEDITTDEILKIIRILQALADPDT
jgi:hypothetical protein